MLSKRIKQTGLMSAASWMLIQGALQGNSAFNQEKPNVIYILADDLGYGDLSCYGQTKFQTPHIDKLAQRGMKFSNHYSGSTVSAPSRSSLMTGEHTGHTPVRGNGNVPLPDKSVTVAEIFKKAGYTTGMFGKWGLGELNTEGEPNKQGFDDYYGYLNQSRAHRYYIDYLIDNGQKDYLPGNDWTNLVTYSADIIHEKALDFIDNNYTKPFFLYCPYTIPHAELIVPDDSILAKFEGQLLPEKNYNGSDYTGPGTSVGGYASQNQCHAVFAAMVYRLDRQVGEIVKKVNDLGIADSTLIIFTSDNGPHSAGGGDPNYFNGSGGLRGIKRDLYEGGIRVPFIASWPGKIAQGTQSDHVSTFWDFLPTCAELVKETVPENVDGISFLPELLGQSGQQKAEFLYWEFFEKNGRRATRMGKWKAVQYGMKDDPYKAVKLFNLNNDPKEETDISAQNQDTVYKLHNLMEMSHNRSKDFSWAYEANKVRVTFVLIANGKLLGDIKVKLSGNGNRITWKNGLAVYTGVSKNSNPEVSVYDGGSVIHTKRINVNSSDIVDTIDLSSVLVVNSFKPGNSIALKLNPISQIATIQSPLIIKNIKIFNLSGKIVFQSPMSSRKASIYLGRLSKGVFTLKVSCKNRLFYRKFILIN